MCVPEGFRKETENYLFGERSFFSAQLMAGSTRPSMHARSVWGKVKVLDSNANAPFENINVK